MARRMCHIFSLCLVLNLALARVELPLGSTTKTPCLVDLYSVDSSRYQGYSDAMGVLPVRIHEGDRMLEATLEDSSREKKRAKVVKAEEAGEKREDPTEILMARQLDPLKVGVLLIILVGITLGLELMMERLPELLDETGRALMDKVYRELALLGLVSFVTFIAEVIFKGTTSAERPWVICFEYAHLLLFCVAIIYIARAGVLVASIRPMRRHLQRLNDVAKHDEHEQITGNARMPDSVAERYLCFGLFRSLFIRTHSLPTQFLFDRYLSYCYKGAIRHALNISPHAWMAVIAICCLDIGISAASPEVARGMLGPLHFLVYGWIILLVSYTLFAAVHRAHWEVEHFLSQHVSDLAENTAEAGGEAGDAMPPSLNISGSRDRKGQEVSSVLEMVRSRQEAIRRQSGRGGHEKDEHAGEGGGERLMVRVLEAARTREEDEEGRNACGRCMAWLTACWRGAALHVVMSQHGALFRSLQDTLSLLESLYLAAYLTTYIYHAVTSLGTLWGVVVAVMTPIPPLLCVLVLSPLMITRYLLVRSTVSVDDEALDLVIDYMTAVEDVFLRIQGLMAKQKENTGDNFLHHTFQQFDINGDGTLSHDEFKKGLRDCGVHLSRREMNALLRFVDEDVSNSIDIQEFSKLLLGAEIFTVKGMSEVQGSSSSSDGVSMSDETKEAARRGEPVELPLLYPPPPGALPMLALERARSSEEAARKGLADGLWGAGGLKRSMSAMPDVHAKR